MVSAWRVLNESLPQHRSSCGADLTHQLIRGLYGTEIRVKEQARDALGVHPTEGGRPLVGSEPFVKKPSTVPFLVLFMIISLFACSHTFGGEPQGGEQIVVAHGAEGFQVVQSQVEEMGAFFREHTPFETTAQELRRYTVCAYLFATEARQSGLSLPENFKPLAPVHATVALAELYLDHVLHHYPLDPAVIESYYRAHSDEFDRTQGDEQAKASSPDVPPWQKVEPIIRERLLSMKKNELRQTHCDVLRQRYRVEEEEQR